MEQKEYLNAIKRKLRCGSAKKKEIVRQLNADMEAALEKGRTLEQVIGEIGAPEAVAEEFNADMSEKDKRRGKHETYAKLIVGILVIGCLVAAAVWWFLPKVKMMGKDGRFTEQAVVEKAKQVIGYLDADDYDAMVPMMREDAAQVLTREVLEEAKQMVAADSGAFVAWGNAYVTEISQYGQHAAAVELSVSYENTSVTYTLMFDEEMRLTGLYMR